MGVRGLTTYIARYAEQYLHPHELRDCNIVIDGDNFASQIHRLIGDCNSAFGGDYDYYYQQVCDVFNMFKQCNVIPYVLLDGGYENRKIQTVKSRFRKRIAAVKYVNPHDCKNLFPHMMREVFIDAVRDCGVKLMRCIYEADDEIAILARKLKCPVLSYDSDFYIHNVEYIPISSVTFRVYKAVQKKNSTEWDIVSFNMKKQKVENLPQNGYFFMDCCLYETKNLITKELEGLKIEILPLFATLLGNDYIERKMMRRFYKQVSVKKFKRGANKGQRRIYSILHWLKSETIESALRKILGHVPKNDRNALLQNIQTAMMAYTRDDSESYVYFGFTNDPVENENPRLIQDCLKINTEDIPEAPENSESSSSEDEDDDDNGNEIEDTNMDCTLSKTDNYVFPEWFEKRFLNGEFSRFLVNLFTMNLYISTPQVEDFEQPDSNLISEDIFMFLYTLIHHPNKPDLNYMTRNIKGHAVVYKTFECIKLNESIYDSNESKNFSLFQHVLLDLPNIDNSSAVFPVSDKLFLIALLFWTHRSQTANTTHVQSVILGYLYFAHSQSHFGILHNITKSDHQKLKKKMQAFFNVPDKLKTKHSGTTYSAIHPFAEFQSVVFNLNNLNALLNYPYEPIKIQNIFNGTFLYNMSVNLKGRNDILNYIKSTLLHSLSKYILIYSTIFDYLKLIMSDVIDVKNVKKRFKAGIKPAGKSRRKKIEDSSGSDEADVVAGNDNSNDESDFDDVNNKFSVLMKI